MGHLNPHTASSHPRGDLLGVGRDWDSDRLIVRFAVVHRERMVAW